MAGQPDLIAYWRERDRLGANGGRPLIPCLSFLTGLVINRCPLAHVRCHSAHDKNLTQLCAAPCLRCQALLAGHRQCAPAWRCPQVRHAPRHK